VPLLNRSEFEAVRAAIDVSLSDDILPDEQIELDIFQGAGERELLVLVPTAADLVDIDPRIRSAAILFVAARICPRVPDIVREAFGQQSYQRSARDMNALAAKLRNEALAIANQIAGVVDPAEAAMPTFFTVASARRHRVEGMNPGPA